MANVRWDFFAKRRGRPSGRAALSLTNDRIGLVAAGPAGPRALERDAGVDPAATRASMVAEAGAAGVDCEWVLEAGQFSLLQVDKPAVPRAEWVQALRWKVRDLLPFPFEEAVMDAFEVPGLESRGRPPTLYLAVGRKDDLRPRIAQIAASGLRLDRIGIADLAWAEVSRRLGNADDSLATLVLDPRGGTMLALREQALFVSRRFEFDAEDQRALRDPQAGGIERLHERIARELQRTLDYFDRTHQRTPPRRLLLACGVDGLEGLEAALRTLLGLDVIIAPVEATWPVLATVPAPARSRLAALVVAGEGA